MIKYLLTLCVLLSACSTECDPVDYEITEDRQELFCNGHDEEFLYEDKGCDIVSCIWHCNAYEDIECGFVNMKFVSCQDGFYLHSVYTEEGGLCE